MEQKTQVFAEDGKQEILITRIFDLPLELLFTAYTNPGIVEQWMGTKVLKLDCRKHGSYQFETTDPMGEKHGFNGTIHEFEPNKKITRTFEMEGTGFPVQIEYLTFEQLSPETSKLTMHVVYKSGTDRDNMLKLPFRMGINRAHNMLQDVVGSLKHGYYEKEK